MREHINAIFSTRLPWKAVEIVENAKTACFPRSED
jgi:hypothetical protein